MPQALSQHQQQCAVYLHPNGCDDVLSSDLDGFLLTSHVAIAVAYALRVFVHAPLSMRRWLPSKPIARVALDGSA